ncbi:carboxylating nicotinate-nucleotide diphosphorylase [Candidatus Peregrinibacteria bacterium]|nr:carboxylating nicotinate-nucleotide diphosphorylase [Candidatus Peregrinibacteria bacterium]
MASVRSKICDFSDELTVKNLLYRDFFESFTGMQFQSDVGDGDLTSELIFKDAQNAKTEIVARESGIVAGMEEVECGCSGRLKCEILKKDGVTVKKNDVICRLSGELKLILRMERTLLNFIGRMSGVATHTARIVDKVKRIAPGVEVACTRKTLWGLLDKKACAVGGGCTHRLSLSDAILIKDNHLDALNRNVTLAISSCLTVSESKVRFIEIEVENFKEAMAAVRVFKKYQDEKKITVPCLVMLDNLSPDAAKLINEELKKRDLRKCIYLEVSGGINEKNMVAYAKTGADIVSMGCLTKDERSLDVSLEVKFQ